MLKSPAGQQPQTARDPRRTWRWRTFCAAAAAVILAAVATPMHAQQPPAEQLPPRIPTDAEIQQSIDRGVSYLKDAAAESTYGRDVLVALALAKAGVSKDDPAVDQGVKKALSRVNASGVYAPGDTPVYVAGIDLMLLETVDPAQYKSQMTAIANWLMRVQFPFGAWGYLDNMGQGDTSQTQYALLGLWSAARAGVEIPMSVWDRAAIWHLQTQTTSGAFAYHPPLGGRGSIGTHSMTAAAVGSLYILRSQLYPSAKPHVVNSPTAAAPEKKFGVLDGVDLSAPKIDVLEPQPQPRQRQRPEPVTGEKPNAPLDAIDRAIDGGLNWLAANYGIARAGTWPLYFLYAIERMTALGDLQHLGGRDWYYDGAAFCLSTQLSGGNWSRDDTPSASTAFVVLFLTRATNKMLNRAKPGAPINGGLLAGGRGLPENLNEVQVADGKIKARQISGPIDELLAALEKVDDAPFGVESVQEAIVEQIQVGDRDKLVGQIDRLRKLAKDPRAEVRRTALWALGRSRDLTVASLLLKGLTDSDVGVMIEARNALCVLSRKPRGFGEPASPLQGLPEDASENRREKAIQEWQAAVFERWQKWYFSVRPYDHRDDLTEAVSGR